MGLSKLVGGAVLLALGAAATEICGTEGYYDDSSLIIETILHLQTIAACKEACQSTSGCLSYQYGNFPSNDYSECNLFSVNTHHNDISPTPGSGYFFYDVVCPVGDSTSSTTPMPTPTPFVCSSDNCLRNLIDSRFSSMASEFCSTYTTTSNPEPTDIPSYLGNCEMNPSRVSSACTCLQTSTSSSSSSQTTTSSSSSESFSSSATLSESSSSAYSTSSSESSTASSTTSSESSSYTSSSEIGTSSSSESSTSTSTTSSESSSYTSSSEISTSSSASSISTSESSSQTSSSSAISTSESSSQTSKSETSTSSPTTSQSASESGSSTHPPLTTSTTTEKEEYTTSTVYVTTEYTITSCAPTVTNCPVGSVTTKTIATSTTICPITSSTGLHPTKTSSSGSKPDTTSYVLSTVYETKTYVITSCAPTVTNCPVGSITTETKSLYTTYCPASEVSQGPSSVPTSEGEAKTSDKLEEETKTTALVETTGAPAPSKEAPASEAVSIPTAASSNAGVQTPSSLVTLPVPTVASNATVTSSSEPIQVTANAGSMIGVTWTGTVVLAAVAGIFVL